MRHLYRIGPLVPLMLGVAAIYGATQLGLGNFAEAGAGLWPFLVAVALTIVAAGLFFFDAKVDYEDWDRGSLMVVGGVFGLAIFIALFERIGLMVPAFLLLLFWLRIMAREKWRLSLPLALVGAFAVQYLFGRVLGVPFPDDIVLTTSMITGGVHA